MKSLRLLLIADSNNPEWVSVPLVSHNHSTALSRIHEVTLLTHGDNRAGIESCKNSYKQVRYITMPWLDKLEYWAFNHIFKRDFGSQALTLFRVPIYLMFEWRAWRAMRKELAAGAFDVVLRLTPVSPAMPSFLSGRLKRLGVPFVVGPINGGLPWPPGFQQASRDKEWIGKFRKLYRFLPYMASTYRDAKAIMVGSTQTWKEMQPQAERVFFVPENGIHADSVKVREQHNADKPLELIFVGRLVALKACDLALEAAAPLIKQGRARFTVIGAGKERADLEALVRKLGIESSVEFTGELKHDQAMAAFARSDALVFPSIRDFGGGVVFEALALGCVPLVADYGGPADIVTDDVGFRIPLTDLDKTREGFTAALEKLETDRALLRRMSEAGQVFARDSLSWDGKVTQTTQVLEWACGRGEKPHLVPPKFA